jgi:hypothetical protein
MDSADNVISVERGHLTPDRDGEGEDLLVPEITLRELVGYFVGSGREHSRTAAEIREVASGLCSELPSEADVGEEGQALTREALMKIINEELEDD